MALSSPPPRAVTRAEPPLRRSGLVMVAAAAASWGTWSLFLRPSHLPAAVTAPILFLVMGLVALPAALRSPRTAWDRATLGLLATSALFDGLNAITFFAAMDHTTVAIAVLTHYLAPILVALAAPWIDGVTARGTGPAACVALAGLAIILEPWHAPAAGALVGALLGMASAVCYTGSVFAARRLALRMGVARMQAYRSLIVGVAMAPLIARHGDQLTPGSLGLVAAGAATIGGLSGIVFAIGLTRIGSARTAVLTFFEPIVAVAVGALVWDEPLHPVAMLGGVLVLGAGIEVARKAR